MTICPYKLVLMGITVVFAALVAIYSIPEEDEAEDEYADEKRREKEAHAARHARRRSLRSSSGAEIDDGADGDTSAVPLFGAFARATDWMAYRPRWFRDFKRGSPKTFRSFYLCCVTLLIIFHLEIFSGGWICRQLFAKAANATLVGDANVSAAGIAV